MANLTIIFLRYPETEKKGVSPSLGTDATLLAVLEDTVISPICSSSRHKHGRKAERRDLDRDDQRRTSYSPGGPHCGESWVAELYSSLHIPPEEDSDSGRGVSTNTNEFQRFSRRPRPRNPP